MGGLLRTLARVALRRGLGGGSRDWLFLSAVLGVLGWIRRKQEEPPEVIHREVLAPGETISVQLFEPPG